MKIRLFLKIGVLVTFLFLLVYGFGCRLRVDPSFRQVYNDYNSFVHAAPPDPGFLKVHYKDGNVVVYNTWDLNNEQDSISGNGKLFDLKREVVRAGTLSTALDQIAIIETNQIDVFKDRTKSRISGLSLLTGVDVILGIICITAPKACFGSCPTFYLNETDNVHFANAEAFSSSIAPSMEQNDIDALNVKAGPGSFRLFMKNEALETHVVNQVQIAAAEAGENEHIFHGSDDRFYRAQNVVICSLARSDDENITEQIKTVDENEYFSLSDPTDLGARQELLLTFKNDVKFSPGLLLNFRQSLLTTFLLYEGISYMGDEVGDYFARIETSKLVRNKLRNPFKTLGGIKVYVFDSQKGKWTFVSELYETGPIARNQQLIPLPKVNGNDEHIQLKLEMTRGMWRLDYAGLADISEEVSPLFLSPTEITKENLPEPEALNELACDDGQYLISMPGDEWKMDFDLPEPAAPGKRYELFLSAKGYYLEWIRGEWLANKNPERLKKMLLNDKDTWRELAIEYKIYESQMEELFWNSKYEINQ